MAKLNELKVARDYVKSSITRIEKFCNAERFATAPPGVVYEKKQRLIKAFQDYEQMNQTILCLDSNDSEDYSVVEEKHDACLELINRCLVVSQSSNEQSCLESPSQGKFKQLPPISLNKFDGRNIMDYYPFINMFKAVIHSDVKLSACEKLYYLRSYLLGEALDLIKHLMFDDESYEVAIKLLEDRYDNKPKIHLAALKNLGEKVEFWDTLLVNILSKKVDSYTSSSLF